MSLDLFYSRAGHLMRRANQIAVAIFLEEAAGLDLTAVQHAALAMIDEVPEIDQATLSSMIALDKTSLVKVLDRLVEKGLITRTQSPVDRRRHVLAVTPRGHELIKKLMPVVERCEQRILAPLSAADRPKFIAMLGEVVRVNNIYSRAPLDDQVLADVTRKRPRRRGPGPRQ